MIDRRECENLARESGAYKDIEFDILRETFSAWEKNPGKPYSIIELRYDKILAGFAVIRREEAANYTFNVQDLCIEPSYLSAGASADLLSMIEEETRGTAASAILRFETSSEKAARLGAEALLAAGYSLIGHIPDFYGPRNDYFMYAKHLNVREAKPEDGIGQQGEDR